MKEIKKRFEEYETGKVKGISLKVLEKNARQSYKKKKAALDINSANKNY